MDGEITDALEWLTRAGYWHAAEKIRDSLQAAEARVKEIVWHHPDGRMVKIKARDFGLKRTPDADRTSATRGKDS